MGTKGPVKTKEAGDALRFATGKDLSSTREISKGAAYYVSAVSKLSVRAGE